MLGAVSARSSVIVGFPTQCGKALAHNHRRVACYITIYVLRIVAWPRVL